MEANELGEKDRWKGSSDELGDTYPSWCDPNKPESLPVFLFRGRLLP